MGRTRPGPERRPAHGSGHSLVEMLVILAVGLILAGWVAPAFTRLLQDMEGERAIHSIRAAVHLARTVAVQRGVPTTVCPLAGNGRCNGNWSRGWTVFRDPRRRSRVDDAGAVVRHFDPVDDDARLVLRAFRTSRYFRMLPNGQTDWQNGRFVYCPPPDRGLKVRALVINVQGRSRLRPPGGSDPACDQ